MHILKLDHKTNEFVLDGGPFGETHRFPGTVAGAINLNEVGRMLDYVSMSSDLNHPSEFPEFEAHSIDIAAGYMDGAVEAGLIQIKEDNNVPEGSDF